jgi:hypothetical protein
MKSSRPHLVLLSGLVAAAGLAAMVSIGDAQVIGPVTLTKAFTPDRVPPSGSVTLAFTIENLDPNGSVAADIGFSDDLGAALPGLVATGLPASNVCGPGSQIAGTAVLTFTGGSVAAGASCTFSVTLTVPVAAAPGDHVNTTSSLTALLEGREFVGTPATSTLTVPPVPVPTLQWWGLMALVAFLVVTALRRLQRGQSPSASR